MDQHELPDDVEELRQLLATDRQRYADLFELATDAYFVVDQHGKILEANGNATRLLGHEAELVVGRRLSVFVSAGSRPALGRALLHAGREPLALELQYISRDGRLLDGELRVVRSTGDGGSSKRLCMLRAPTLAHRTEAEWELHAKDLEERLRGQDAERRRLRLLLERLREGVVAIDRRLRVAFANSEAMRILAPAQLAVGHPLPEPWKAVSLRELGIDLFAPDAEPVERLVEARASGRILSLTGIPAQSTDQALLVIVDVSERERRERAEREFVANAAHELRTPLAAITSAVEVLQAGAKESPEARERFLRHLTRETRRLGLLTRALLLLARVQSGSEKPRMEMIDVAELIDEAAADLIPSDRVELHVECRPRLAAVGNRELAAQALANVAANAVKFTREGRIVVAGRSLNGSAVIEVADSGPGIPESERELVRRRFYRVGDRGANGFGLGLAIADQAITAIGGKLEIDAADGGGTVVRIVLPGAELVT